MAVRVALTAQSYVTLHVAGSEETPQNRLAGRCGGGCGRHNGLASTCWLPCRCLLPLADLVHICHGRWFVLPTLMQRTPADFVHDMMAFANETCDTIYEVYPAVVEHDDCELLVRNAVDPVLFNGERTFCQSHAA